MNTLFDLTDKAKLKNIDYVKDKGCIGVADKGRRFGVFRLNNDKFELSLYDISVLLDRATLSEFLHASASFVDGEYLHRPVGEMIACEYQEQEKGRGSDLGEKK